MRQRKDVVAASCAAAVVASSLLASGIGPADAEISAPVSRSLCSVIEAAATHNGLPIPFFTRLIWQESRFNAAARSPAGAEGVAQFMPRTAVGRGLLDPFEPGRALDESAAYLRELREAFGNLGLAAAAYNAGPGRLGRWIAGKTALPQETIDYVATITGHSVFEWHGPSPPVLPPEPNFSCQHLLEASGAPAITVTASLTTGDDKAAPPKPWAVILVGAFQKSAAISEFQIVRGSLSAILKDIKPTIVRRSIGGQRMLKYVVQIEEDDRATGDRLCKRLEASGGACVVLRNLPR